MRVYAAEIDLVLLFLSTLAQLLAGTSSDEVFLFITGKCLALRELLLGSLVSLADGKFGSKLSLLLSQLCLVFIIAFGDNFWLGWLSISSSAILSACGVGSPCFTFSVDGSWNTCIEALLLFFLGDSLTSILVVQFRLASLIAPAMPSLLVMFTG